MNTAMALPKPLIVILSLEEDDLFRSTHSHLRDTLVLYANSREISTPDQALRALNSTIRPHAVIVADAFVTKHAYRDIVVRLVDYAKAGGTVLYAGCFSSFVGPIDLSAHFETVWKLPWRYGGCYRAKFIPNPSSTTGVHLPQLVLKYSMRAVLLKNVNWEDALVLEKGDIDASKKKRTSGAKFKAPATFTVVGTGRFGFVGDVNGEPSTTDLVLAMCLYPGSQAPTSPGTGAPAPGSTESMPWGPHPKPGAHVATTGHLSSTSSTGLTAPPSKRVFVIALQNKPTLQENYSQIFSGLSCNASITLIRDVNTAAATVSASSCPGDVVLVADGAILQPAHNALLYKLIHFAHEGATVVLAMDFYAELTSANARTFFGRWGLPWDVGDYLRTTFVLNPAGLPPPLSARALQPECSMKAVLLTDVPCDAAVYLPGSDSHIESLVFAPTPIRGAEAQMTTAAFARVGQGYLGFVGDVNGEQGSARLTLEMCGVAIKPGDMGCRRYVSSCSFRNRVVSDEQIAEQAEIPLPYALDTVPRTTTAEGYVFGSGIATVVGRVRDREAEVRARAERRARMRALNDRKTEALAKEGMRFIKKERWSKAADKYRTAALLGGPHPVVLSNLAWAFIKLKQWAAADSAAGRAILYDPKNVKAIYRRGLARKEMGRFTAAESDFAKVVSLDGAHSSARTELQTVQTYQRTRLTQDWPEDEHDLGASDEPLEPEDESDTEDFAHKGNGAPCKSYNGAGCTQGKRCQFSHALDSRSVRDELGRNVCLYWLVGECVPTEGPGTCGYAHDATYLPSKGWWKDTKRLARLGQDFNAAVGRMPLSVPGGAVESILAEALRPGSWRNDLWVTAPSTVAEDDESETDDGF